MTVGLVRGDVRRVRGDVRMVRGEARRVARWGRLTPVLQQWQIVELFQTSRGGGGGGWFLTRAAL